MSCAVKTRDAMSRASATAKHMRAMMHPRLQILKDQTQHHYRQGEPEQGRSSQGVSRLVGRMSSRAISRSARRISSLLSNLADTPLRASTLTDDGAATLCPRFISDVAAHKPQNARQV